MNCTFFQRRAFQKELQEMLPDDLLETIVLWIAKNLTPAEVFPVDDLKAWAEENYDCPECAKHDEEAP